jgi:plastocyanin
MVSRREFLQAGGRALAGLGLPSGLARAAREGGALLQAGRGVEIRMRSDAQGGKVWFDPTGVRVASGTIVRWVLVAGAHSVTAYHPANGNRALRIPPAADPWDSGMLIEPGQTFEQRLVEPGVYDYFCPPHEMAGMVGRIVVAGDSDGSHLVEPAPAGDEFRAPPAAALAAFPSIERIREAGVVRRYP